MSEKTEIRTQAGPQTKFLSTPADIAIFGGAAGGGKSVALLLEPLRHIHNPDFGAVIFRRTFPQITQEKGLWDEATKLYGALGARLKETTLEAKFPSGARVRFAHMQYEHNKLDWQGSQIPLIGWDEVTHFTAGQFWYMFSRSRSTCGVRPYVRATCNPDPDSFIADLISWWIDQESGYPIPERAGRLRWFIRLNDELIWADSAAELRAKHPDVPPKSLTFIPAKLSDNPALMRKDPGYLANLMAQPLVDRERLLGGNWKIRPAAGKVFNRAWFEIVPRAPAGGLECRFFDFAATAKKLTGNDPDYTAGVKIRKAGGQWFVIDAVAEQLGPAEGDTLFLNTALQDALAAKAGNRRYMIRWEQEGGSSGIKESRRLVGLLTAKFAEHGLTADAKGVPPKGDKLARGKSLASHALVGDVKLEAGAWNEAWLRHMHGQPDLAHDDLMDASTGAFNELAAAGQSWQARSQQG